MAELTPTDLANFADRYLETPWAVYVQGLDEVFTCVHTDRPPGHKCPQQLQRETALKFAAEVRESVAIVAHLHGISSAASLTPFVLHHGIVWSEP